MKPDCDFHEDGILTVWSARAVQRIGMMGRFVMLFVIGVGLKRTRLKLEGYGGYTRRQRYNRAADGMCG